MNDMNCVICSKASGIRAVLTGMPKSFKPILAIAVWTLALCMACTFAWALDADTLPNSGSVSAGSGTIFQSGNTMTIDQTSQKLAIDWQDFSIGSKACVNFNQPDASAIALNRITGSDKSRIYGSLNANGQVFLLNSNGILFGRSAEVNLGGLVAGTLDLTNKDFLSGNYRFRGTPGRVVNQGSLSGDYVALLGGQVSNQGRIQARLGTAALAAGSVTTLDFAGDGLINIQVDRGAVDALADNHQLITADGGTVIMTAGAADDLIRSVVNNQGHIRAHTLDTSRGTIKLLAGNGRVRVGGTLDTAAPDGGDGGFIETSAEVVTVAADARVTTLASGGETGTWLIDPTDFTVSSGNGSGTASGIGAATLAANLETGNITLETDNTGGTEDGDIHVDASVSWNAATTLTLDAYDDININADISATAGSLSLRYGQGTADGGTSGYHLNNNARVNLSPGVHFFTKTGTAGPETGYTVITDLGAQGSTTQIDLQGLQDLDKGNFVLGADIDAGVTSTWNGGEGFEPIGTERADFSFDGLGHTISNLYINRPDSDKVGLFSFLDQGTRIANLGLKGGSITGDDSVGALAGRMDGAIISSYVTGAVNGKTRVGGLAGTKSFGAISNSYTTGEVSGKSQVGGLAGFTGSDISNSYATGDVTGSQGRLGGLVGTTYFGTISNSYATGAVNGSITDSSYAGGLVGNQDYRSTISNSYATGKVTGKSYAGGLVGSQEDTDSTITNSYATGKVTGERRLGGLVGYGGGHVDSSNFWDTDTSGQINGCEGSISCTPTGLTTAGMQSRVNFSSTGWNISSTGGSSADWRIYEGQTYPLLRSLLTPLTITADSGSRSYDGTMNGLGVSYSMAPDQTLLSGTLSTAVSGKNTGEYTTMPSGLYSVQQGYDIAYVSGRVIISPALLTLSGTTAADKVYDSTTDAAITAHGTLTGLAAGETLILETGNVTAEFDDPDAGTHKTVTASGYTISDGTGSAANYTLASTLTSAAIIPKTVSITGTTAADKVYDGSTEAAITAHGTLTGFVAGETLILETGSVTAEFDDPNAGTHKNVTASGYTISDGTGSAANYTLASTLTSAAIIPKTVGITGTTAGDKVYDGTTEAAITAHGNLTGLVAGETLILETGVVAAEFDDPNAGTHKTVTVQGYAISDGTGLAGNYTLASTLTSAAITPKIVSITGVTAADKVYDGTTEAAIISHGTLTGLVAGETLVLETGVVTAEFDDPNVGADKNVTAGGYAISNGKGLAGNYSLESTFATTKACIMPDILSSIISDTIQFYPKTFGPINLNGGNQLFSFIGSAIHLPGGLEQQNNKNEEGEKTDKKNSLSLNE